MDTDTIKLVLGILYLTCLVAAGLIWFRLKHTPNGELYRKLRAEGGYMPEGIDEDGAEVPPPSPVQLRRARYPSSRYSI